MRWLNHCFRHNKEKIQISFEKKIKTIIVNMLLFFLSFGIFALSSCEPSKVKVLLFDYKSYVISGESSKGWDVAILKNFAQKHKLGLELIETNVSIPEISDISDIDIIAVGLGWKTFSSDHFIESRSYHYDRMTWCVMKKPAIQSGYEIFHLYDDVFVWIFCSIEVMMILCFAYYLQQFERHPKWDWNRLVISGLSYFCCLSGTYAPKTTANRILFTAVLLNAIVIDTFIIGLFLNKMQLQKKDYSIDQIFDGSYKLVGDPFIYQYLKEQNQVCENSNELCMNLLNNF